MAYEFRLPEHLAPEGSEGLLVTWFKDEGGRVAKGELLLEVQFEKASSDVEAPVAGQLSRILVQQGEIVRPGQALCLIAEAAGGEDAAAGPHHTVRASPAAKRLAQELGVNLEELTGTGPGGRIIEADIRAAAAGKGEAVRDGGASSGTAVAPRQAPRGAPTAPEGVSGRTETLTLGQRVVAQRMQESLRTMAQLTLGREADVTALTAVRAVLKAGPSPATLTDLIHRAVVVALTEHPRLQARWQGEESLLIPDGVHLGFAVARGEDLLVPVIRGAHNLNLDGLARERQRLSAAVQAGRVTPQELQGGTFTVTSLGPQGVDLFTPIINAPEAAILGVGRVVDRPGFDGEALVPRRFMTLSLTFDHRRVNGAPAALFLGRVAELLESPWSWLHVS